MPKVDKTPRQPKMVSGEGYCRKCQKTMPNTKFYEASNPMLDSNGLLSICRECCNDIYTAYFGIYNNMETALQLTCQDLDVRFSQDALRQCQSHVEGFLSKGKKADAVFGYYKSKLGSIYKKNDGVDSFRYRDSDFVSKEYNNASKASSTTVSNIDLNESDFTLTDEIVKYWGKGRDKWEYEFLEEEIFRIKTDFECSDYGMAMIMRDICFINLDIEKIRQGFEKGDIGRLIELRSKSMNDGNLKPVQSTGADKNEKVSLGVFIKKWENEKPIRQEMDDEMKRYIDTYMVGHLAKMEGYNNDTVKHYNDAIKEYTIDFNDIGEEDDDE